MTLQTRDLIEICERLPDEKRDEVIDFARFLLARQDEQAWEKRIADPQRRPKLDAFVAEAMTEGNEPLDVEKM